MIQHPWRWCFSAAGHGGGQVYPPWMRKSSSGCKSIQTLLVRFPPWLMPHHHHAACASCRMSILSVYSKAQHSTAQYSTAHHSTAQHRGSAQVVHCYAACHISKSFDLQCDDCLSTWSFFQIAKWQCIHWCLHCWTEALHWSHFVPVSVWSCRSSFRTRDRSSKPVDD